MTTNLKPKRALLSVSDKSGLVPLARALRAAGCDLYASGGTKKVLELEGLEVLPVESISRSPEAFAGRMKTLSFPVFGGILARRNDAADDADREKLGIPLVDVVVVNFYPFEQTIASRPAAADAELTELIDIGGPALVRAAAKNRDHVLVLSDPSLYSETIGDLASGRGISLETRKRAAARAWTEVARYDSAIENRFGEGKSPSAGRLSLRYGENPHQTARFSYDSDSPIAWDAPLTESSLSYNNLLDFSAGFRLLADLANWKKDAAHAVIIKHQNPCGVATDVDGRIDAALEMAWACDPTSAFGGMVLLSKPLDTKSAQFLEPRFIEGIAAPGLAKASSELSLLSTKRKNLKAVLIRDVAWQERECEITIPGGRLVQSADTYAVEPLEVKTGETWSEGKRELAQFGIFAGKSLKSNAIAIVESPSEGRFRMIGAGQGQPNRIEAIAKLAIPRARAVLEAEAKTGMSSGTAGNVFVESRLAEMILVSDAFFPFADGVEAAAEAGIRNIVEPGGSVRDADVIARAKELGVNLAFTGRRHFRH
ncbi:MAG: bifunctional phosphoribosylaminoimidazolecarboxamide formyltransferase/IMP cyclohydrolase [Bdellovibrionales bacterium]|nr:bifunctional phosphoribosylaminoimidazolecarboxamide formyltransferase/IMP cyclohydrolase [Bdellovibrionales bacterium]